MLIFLTIFSPLAAALISTVMKKVKALELLAVLSAIIEFIAGLAIALKVSGGEVYKLGSYFAIDALSAVILFIVSIVGLSASVYSVGYLREEVKKGIIGFRRVRQYFILLNLFLMAMFFAVSTTNPILMWIAIEATTLSTAFLISFYNKPSSMEAAWKYLIINSVGLLLGFFGTLLYFTVIGGENSSSVISWPILLANASHLNPLVAKIAFIFVTVGYGTKVGFAPMHTWLPDTHSKAPAPISGLLSGVLLSVAFLAVLRFRSITNAAIGPEFTGNLLIAFGTFSMVIAAFIIFVQPNYKRLLAYSSIEHMGIAALGFGFGGLGIFAGLLHLIYHALSKSFLFFTAGNTFLKFSSTRIAEVRGALTKLPVTGILLMAGFLAITGVPPFGIFISEFYIFSAGVSQHLLPTIVALLAVVLIFAGFLQHFSGMVFGEAPASIPRGENGILTLLPPLFLLSLLVILSLFLPAPLVSLLNSAALIAK